ncbi:HD domain-containing protein [Patescibacteria group bacterium]|nr:HD domain-containing protein [Patescibacteria group bacterium]
MTKDKQLKKTQEYVRKTMHGCASCHDFWHVYRVRKIALNIGKEEEADLYSVELAALLHDIADHKFYNGDMSVGPKKARAFLESIDVDEKDVDHMCDIIAGLSFKGSGTESPMKTLEGKVVQDADRLDAIGATGIARTFAYGGYKGREIYNPNTKPEMHTNFEEYSKSEGSTINHFHEKLLLLKDRMNTNTGKEMAEKRHAFLEEYLHQFYLEQKENEL